MDHRIPRIGLALSLVCTALALLTFVVLNQAFEGPNPVSVIEGEPYELEATFHDTEALPTKQPVLVRGVPVGKVTAVDYEPGTARARVTFTVDDDYGPVNADASVTIGERTLLGDPYLNLSPGTEGKPKLDSGASVDARPSVDFDEAFDFLDADGRRHLDSIIDTLDEATRSPRSGTQLNQALGELSRTVAGIRALTDALHGQEPQISGFVGDSSIVLTELGRREDALRRVVASGRLALDALASNTDSLSDGIAELPGVLASGAEALRRVRPLLREARPLVAELRDAAPDLAPAIADIGPLAADTTETVKDVSGLPSLRKLLRVVVLGGPAVPGLEASVRNLVPLLRYTAPRIRGIASFFSNFAGLTAHGDSDGAWARFAIMFEPGELTDQPTKATCYPEDDVPQNAGLCHNAYPEPGDALDPEPYVPGSYPRLRPYDPPPPKNSASARPSSVTGGSP
jgi:phospholipid/cholesterol/gamma-HCH transport system substrate-binding protein